MIRVGIQGYDHNGEPLEADALLPGVPSRRDVLAVWDGDGEVYLEVELVSWSTWGTYEAGERRPTLSVRRPDGCSDEEWVDLFQAIREQRAP